MDASRKSRGVARVKRAAVRFIFIWIPIGFAINVAVAWGLAAWLPHRGWEAEDYSSDFAAHRSSPIVEYIFVLRRFSTFGACRQSWYRLDTSGISFAPFARAIQRGRSKLEHVTDGPLKGQRWGNAEVIRRDHYWFAEDGCEHANGWPLLTAWCEWTCEYANQSYRLVSHGAISITPSSMNARTTPAYKLRALPLRPIWLGLIVNTLSYALFSAALWAGVIALRAWRRKARGRCTRCAYDLTGLGAGALCPECGSGALLKS